jgi:carboxylate-amine ligase
VNADLPRLGLVRDWSQWAPGPLRPWSVRISEDVMVVDPQRGVLAAIGSDLRAAAGPLLASNAAAQFDGSVVTLTTTARDTVAEAAAEVALLRSELATTLATRHGLAGAAAGLHPWSEAPGEPDLLPLRARPMTEVAGILGRFDPLCALRVSVTVPDGPAGVRALDGLRLHVPLLLALAANSPFWRGRYTGLASTRTALRATACQGGLPRGFGSYDCYVATLDALLQAGAIPSAASVEWDVRLRPDLAAVEVTVMDAQTRVAEVAGLVALIQCLVRRYSGDERAATGVIPELILENRSAAAQKGMRAPLIDPAGNFTHRAVDELAMLVDACAPVARELGCSRELASVDRSATDPGHARQRSVTASSGLAALVTELVHDFAEGPVATPPSPTSDDVAKRVPA